MKFKQETIVDSSKLRVERARKRWSQQELAEKVGVSRQTIFNIENDLCLPNINIFAKICKVFGKDFSYFIKQ